jgi:UDP-glucuronate 4-epimerase
MALFLFTKSILNGDPINIYNNGNMVRDFTFIDDIVQSIEKLIIKPAKEDLNFDSSNPNPATSWAPHRIFNIGNSEPTNLMDYIKAIEDNLGIVAKKNFLPMQPGDVKETSAETTLLEEWINFKPYTSVNEGVCKFVNWYKDFYNYK